MNDEDQVYNVSPELRKQLRKAEMQEYHEESESKAAIKKAALLAEENKEELKRLKLQLNEEKEEIKKDMKNEFGSRFAEFGSKFTEVGNRFNDITGKVDKVTGKLEETCTGIDCLKTDLAKLSKNTNLIECPECGQKVVPPLASYCPNCSAKMYSWTEDDGTPVKGWKPNWEK